MDCEIILHDKSIKSVSFFKMTQDSQNRIALVEIAQNQIYYFVILKSHLKDTV